MRSSTTRAALAAFAVALAPAAALAGPTGNVLSNNIKDADGTSGQTTTTGSGVKTGHIQNGAVTAPKLATGAVGTGAIADGALTAPKFAPSSVGTTAIANAAVTAAKLATGAVGTAALQDGAVTAAKLAGAIPASKIDRTGLDADTVDGYHAGAFAAAEHDHTISEIQGLEVFRKKHRNLVVVAKDGTGDFTDPAAAVQSITDASASNPYVVKIMPGVYDVTYFTTWANINVEGSGEGVTTLRILDDSSGNTHFYVQLYGSTELRNLTIEMTNGKGAVTSGFVKLSHVTLRRNVTQVGSGGDQAVLTSYSEAELDHVTVEGTVAAGLTYYPYGLLPWQRMVIRDSSITVTGGQGGSGIFTQGGALEISGSRVAVSGAPMGWGILANQGAAIRDTRVTVDGTAANSSQIEGLEGGGVTCDHCEISARGPAGGTAIRANQTSSFAYTKVDGGFSTWDGTSPRCLGVFDAKTYTPVTCQ